MNRSAAEKQIKQVFAAYSLAPPLPTKSSQLGKLYELYCLSELLAELAANGFRLRYVGQPTAVFKAGPGFINPTDPHFKVHFRARLVGEIHLNIEFTTLGSHLRSVSDFSGYHEIDIVVVKPGTTGRPNPSEILLGIECKAVANFGKRILKEVLGVRRELSFLSQVGNRSLLTSICPSRAVHVPATPPSEYLLFYIDPKGDQYAQSAAAFGIALRHVEPV